MLAIMLRKLNWQGYSSNDRNEIIDKVKKCISSNDAYIMNFNMFSDLALSLSIEIEENKIVDLYNALSDILMMSDFEDENINPKSNKDWLIFMNISFGSGKGELKKEIPAVPG